MSQTASRSTQRAHAPCTEPSRAAAWWRAHRWLVGPTAAGIVVLGLLVRSQNTNGQEYHDELLSIWIEFVELREQEVPPEEWKAFASRVDRQMEPVIADLSETASPEHPALRHLLWAARDSLPHMIQEGPTDSRQAEQKFLEHLRSAAWYLKQTL